MHLARVKDVVVEFVALETRLLILRLLLVADATVSDIRFPERRIVLAARRLRPCISGIMFLEKCRD